MPANSHQPLVSIIISSYNYAPYVKQAIDSALQQSYPFVEIIAVDDGSTDASPDIIKGYGDRIKSILKENKGQASSMNAGFRVSHGDIIIFLDSDDILYEKTVERIVPLFANNRVSKVHWMLDEMDAEGNGTNKRLPKYTLADGDLFDELARFGPGRGGNPPFSPPTSGNAWSRKYLNEIMPIPEAAYKSNTDKYLHFLAPVYGLIRAIHEPLGGYRVHGENYSHHPVQQYAKEFVERYEHICLLLQEHFTKKGISVDTALWPRDSWYHTIIEGINNIQRIVLPGERFVLVDENAWGLDNDLEQRRRYHFMDRDGVYHGPPLNDIQALEEWRRLQSHGVQYLFFTLNAFWWLDHYPEFADHLRNHHTRVLETENMIGFRTQNIY